jgi:hypothetical protein
MAAAGTPSSCATSTARAAAPLAVPHRAGRDRARSARRVAARAALVQCGRAQCARPRTRAMRIVGMGQVTASRREPSPTRKREAAHLQESTVSVLGLGQAMVRTLPITHSLQQPSRDSTLPVTTRPPDSAMRSPAAVSARRPEWWDSRYRYVDGQLCKNTRSSPRSEAVFPRRRKRRKRKACATCVRMGVSGRVLLISIDAYRSIAGIECLGPLVHPSGHAPSSPTATLTRIPWVSTYCTATRHSPSLPSYSAPA